FFFFFQAEDGIRDGHVTGVQTCALPISAWFRSGIAYPGRRQAESRTTSCLFPRSAIRRDRTGRHTPASPAAARPGHRAPTIPTRSEERRVGKEGRSRWAREREKK